MISLKSSYSQNLKGKVKVSGDKSISHRAVILASLAKGESKIEDILFSEDVFRTINVFCNLGVNFNILENTLTVSSKGFNNFLVINNNFYMGNSGTTTRITLPVLASQNCEVLITGDLSLSKRPMKRVLKPLEQMGLKYDSNEGKLPLKVYKSNFKGINFEQEVASAQVKTALMLASFFTNEEVIIKEKEPTRDHSENFFKFLNLQIFVEDIDGQRVIKIPKGEKKVNPFNYKVRGDFSSASFIIAAGLLCKNSVIEIEGVNLNPLRIGLLDVLLKIGANIEIKNKRLEFFEEVGDLVIKTSKLKPIKITKEIVPKMIDEFPILFVLASFIDGESTFEGIEELRVKESDRLKVMEEGLNKIGVKTFSTNNSLKIYGEPSKLKGGVEIDSFLDHRIAMAFLIMGLNLEDGVIVKNAETIATSFPNFESLMVELNANIIKEEEKI